MKTGNGKIANLPPGIRDELNFRISDGDAGNELVAWLNSKPEVTEVVNQLFDGAPISEQNLSEWRKRGYQKWLAHRNFVDESNAISDNSGDIAETGIGCDKLFLTLTAAYAEMIRNWIITPGEQMTYKLAVYKNLTDGVLKLQRAELQKVRLEIAHERLELLREKRVHKSAEAIGNEGIGNEGVGKGAGGGNGKGGASCSSAPASFSGESWSTPEPAGQSEPERPPSAPSSSDPRRAEPPPAKPAQSDPPTAPAATPAPAPSDSRSRRAIAGGAVPASSLPPSAATPAPSPQAVAPIRKRSVLPGTVLSVHPLRIAQTPNEP